MTFEPGSPVSLNDFLSENWDSFKGLEAQFEDGFRKASRDVPPEFYTYVRDKLTTVLGNASGGKQLRSRVVIDSNIVVQDAFRVARGRPSSTDRLLSSPFLEVCAPHKIVEEVSRAIRTDIPKGLSVDTALGHATQLLHRIRLVAEGELRSVARARELLAPFDPDDVPFLALAFDLGASAVVSRDRAAFDSQSEIKRWELRELAQVVTTYESGALSIVITGSAAEVIIPALEQVLVAVGRALLEALAALATLVTALLAGTADALSRVPPWIWAIIGGVLVGLLIWAIFDEDFRDKMAEGLSKLADFAREVGRAIVAAAKAVCKVVYELLAWLWNLVVPIVAVSVLVAGVLFRQIGSLPEQRQLLRATAARPAGLLVA